MTLADCLVIAALAIGTGSAVLAQTPAASSSSAAAPSSAYQQAVDAARRGDFASAARLYEEALETLAKSVGEKHISSMNAMGGLAIVYGSLGRWPDAIAMNERLLKLSIEVYGENHRLTAIAMNALGFAYGEGGRPAEQLPLYEKVLALRMQHLGERHPDTIASMGNLGAAYGALGRFDDKVRWVEKSLKLALEVNGEKGGSTAALLSGLGDAYMSVGRRVEAVSLYERAVKLWTEVVGERHPRTIGTMSSLAYAYGTVGRRAEHLAAIEKVVALSRDVLGEKHPETVRAMATLVLTYGAQGKTAEQLELAQQVLAASTESLGERHPLTLNAVARLAQVHWSQKRPAEAAALADRFVSGVEWLRSQPGLSQENRQASFGPAAGTYRFFSLAKGSQGEVAEGFRLAELSKARTLLESMTALRASHAGGLPAAEQLALDGFNQRVAAVNQQLAETKDLETRQKLDAQRNALTRQYESLQVRLKVQYPKYGQLSEVRILAAAELPGVLPADAAVVSYVVNGNDVGAYVVDTSGKPQYRAIGQVPFLAQAVEALRRASAYEGGLKELAAEEGRHVWRVADGSYRIVEGSLAPAGAVAVSDEAEIARYLAGKLLNPLALDLRSKRRWIISPDGPLAQLPFELLPAGDAHLAMRREVSYTQSLSVFALAQARQKDYAALDRKRDLLAMGNPLYEDSADSSRSRRAQMRSALRNANIEREDQLSSSKLVWMPLPGTEQEVKAVGQLFGGRSDIFTREKASEEQLQVLNASGALKEYRYLLFSVHGNLSTSDPALSSLVLAQRGIKPGTDGYVTAAEWQAYDLRSDLTVLSACETGLGKALSGEGVMGLPFALFVAGNVNTILSLWPVDDEATALFMQQFFARLKSGAAPSDALAATKRAFIANPKFSRPVFWAPFVLVGAG